MEGVGSFASGLSGIKDQKLAADWPEDRAANIGEPIFVIRLRKREEAANLREPERHTRTIISNRSDQI